MLFLSSDNIVQITLSVLIGFSALTWAIILYKVWSLWSVGYNNRNYEKQFWVTDDLDSAARLETHTSALGRIAKTGIKTLNAIGLNTSPRLQDSSYLESVVARSMFQQINKEYQALERGLSLLASIGSTSPFVGLFGTVWGIMHALQSISNAKSASLEVVAGPIGEALITTAIGIAAAIPAVLAYNFFLRRIKLCRDELESFVNGFLFLALKGDFKITGADGPLSK